MSLPNLGRLCICEGGSRGLIPKRVSSTGVHWKHSAPPGEYSSFWKEECIICHNPLDNSRAPDDPIKGEVPDEGIAIVICDIGHCVHINCYLRWVYSPANERERCPACKEPMLDAPLELSTMEAVDENAMRNAIRETGLQPAPGSVEELIQVFALDEEDSEMLRLITNYRDSVNEEERTTNLNALQEFIVEHGRLIINTEFPIGPPGESEQYPPLRKLLHHSVVEADTRLFEMCMRFVREELGGLNINEVDAEGMTALMYAARLGRTDYIAAMLATEDILVDYYLPYRRENMPALLQAAKAEQWESAMALISVQETRGNVNITNSHNQSALYFAVNVDRENLNNERRQEFIARLLAKQNIDVNMVQTEAIDGFADETTLLMEVVTQRDWWTFDQLMLRSDLDLTLTAEVRYVLEEADILAWLASLIFEDFNGSDTVDPDAPDKLNKLLRAEQDKDASHLVLAIRYMLADDDEDITDECRAWVEGLLSTVVTSLIPVDNGFYELVNSATHQKPRKPVRAQQAEERLIKELLARPDLDVNGAQFYRDTGSTLYMAAESGVRTVFDALIADARIAVNVTNLEEDTTALMTAVEHNHTYIVQKLLTHQDIDKEQADSDGQTAVFRLAYMPISDAEDMLDVLVDRGVNINAVDNDNETVLMVLAQECKWSLVELAIERGARVNIKSKAGMTAYDYALTKCTDDLTEDVKRALDPA